MAKIRVTPMNPVFKPKDYTGHLTFKMFDGEVYYYICGESFPSKIVEIIEGEAVTASK